MKVNESHIHEFEQGGAVTLDGPFSREAIEQGNKRVEKLHAQGLLGGGASFIVDQMLLDLIQHPALEAAAKRFLRADEVEFVAWVAMQKDPQPGTAFRQEGEHQDIRYSRRAIDATPRAMLVTFLLWLTDVTIERAPFMYRRGSHRQIAEHVNHAQDPGEEACQVAGYFGAALPALEYAEPQPILATAGQISAVTTSLVHSGSSNTGTLPRRVMFINFSPKGLRVLFDQNSTERHDQYRRELRSIFRPERRHLLPS